MSDKKQYEMKPTKPISYAIGMFGTSIPINMFKTFAAKFYVDDLAKITSTQFASILSIYTFIDALDNPLYGYLSDRTRSPIGRRRPWLLIGSVFLVICFILFFSPPASLSAGAMFYYIMVMYMLTGTLDSLINSNYGALFPELFKDKQVRAKTNAMRQVFQFIAMILSIALTPVIVGGLGSAENPSVGYRYTSWIYGIIALAVIWYMTLSSHEDFSAMDKPKPSLFGSLKAVLSNKKFWIYGVANAAFAAAFSLIQAGVPFYVKYYLKLEDSKTTVLLGTAILSVVIFIPFWVKIIKKLTLMPAWRLSFLIIAVCMIPLYFTKNLIAAVLALLPVGFGVAGVSATMDVVAARILDEDAKKYGVQREGTYSSLIGVLNKTSGLFTALGYFLVDKIYGYVDGNNTGASPDGAARFLTVLFPIILFIVAVIFSKFLKFNEAEHSDSFTDDESAAIEN
jgi:GPH family glycoside/pentoside/hexuronide:cation symporter